MSIHNETINQATQVVLEGGEPPSRDPVPEGKYPCTIVMSSYDETSRDCVFDDSQMVVRPVYDYKTQTESPITDDEKTRGFSVHKSGTYVWLRLKVSMPDGTERFTSVRPNWINVLRPPNEDRVAITALRDAIGAREVDLIVGQPVTALHERPFIAHLEKKDRRGSPGKQENWLKGASPLQTRHLPPGATTAHGAQVVDRVGSDVPPISAYEDADVVKHF